MKKIIRVKRKADPEPLAEIKPKRKIVRRKAPATKSVPTKHKAQLPFGGVPVSFAEPTEAVLTVGVTLKPLKFGMSKHVLGAELEVCPSVYAKVSGTWRMVSDANTDGNGQFQPQFATTITHLPEESGVRTTSGGINHRVNVDGDEEAQRRVAEHVAQVLQESQKQLSPERIREVACGGN